MAKLGNILCPSCGSRTGVQILHGPPVSPAGKRGARSLASPRYRCIRCGFEWSENPRK